MAEGDENLKGQVEFLNSVIVDMQRKNDELKSKLELLENAGVLGKNNLVVGRVYLFIQTAVYLFRVTFSDESIEFYFNGVSARQAAPRLFCDICDEFDLHDTEDCPKQVTNINYPLQLCRTKDGEYNFVDCQECKLYYSSNNSSSCQNFVYFP